VWKEMVYEIDYIKQNLKGTALYDLIYQMKAKYYDRGYLILKNNDLAKSLIFIDYGVLEVYTEFEGNEFIIENLHPGSCINARAFLMEDTVSVNIRVKEHCKIMELSKETFLVIMRTHEEFGKQILFL
jgi:CRP-like cAMP-binding protein